MTTKACMGDRRMTQSPSLLTVGLSEALARTGVKAASLDRG